MTKFTSFTLQYLTQLANVLADMFGVPVSQLWLVITFYTILLLGALIAVSQLV